MRSFQDICKDVGYNSDKEAPKRVRKIYGYAKGQLLGTFDSDKEARDAGAKSTELVIENEDIIKAFKNSQGVLRQAAMQMFKYELFNENISYLGVLAKLANPDSLSPSLEEIKTVFDKIYSHVELESGCNSPDDFVDYFDNEMNYLCGLFPR